ncbi:low choriolytic enzyme [Genypterus blacodes]|uniref:low choriolytic enzyme n=1 Tax=Genypterus blacodes TaxID=154954 RepID=UPI003F75E0B9
MSHLSHLSHLLVAALLLVKNLKQGNCSPVPEPSTVHHEKWIMKALHYMETNPETADELMSSDYALVEGDTILPSDRNAMGNLWASTQIPYLIMPELANRREDILSAMNMVSKDTCVTFTPRTTETTYLSFTYSYGCSSYVGSIGGAQPLFIGPPCSTGNICHEILHALGFHHEHTRADRDNHITILTHNIMKGMHKNFKIRDGETFGLPYDVHSIMHYGRRFFSANDLPTIVAKGDAEDMGQRRIMTMLDIQRVRHLYKCDPQNLMSNQDDPEDLDCR